MILNIYYLESYYPMSSVLCQLKLRTLLLQIFRRADPAGRTIGEFVRGELSAKVGGADVFVGLPESGESFNAFSESEDLF